MTGKCRKRQENVGNDMKCKMTGKYRKMPRGKVGKVGNVGKQQEISENYR